MAPSSGASRIQVRRSGDQGSSQPWRRSSGTGAPPAHTAGLALMAAALVLLNAKEAEPKPIAVPLAVPPVVASALPGAVKPAQRPRRLPRWWRTATASPRVAPSTAPPNASGPSTR